MAKKPGTSLKIISMKKVIFYHQIIIRKIEKKNLHFEHHQQILGFGLLSVISAYDLGYEKLEDTLNLLEKMINTISNLQKWNGHLYNWYNLKNLEPLMPRYVSSVDSGNFVRIFICCKTVLFKFSK